MADPKEVVNHISRLLSPEGCALIRIPVSDSNAWHKYRECWVGLDAPRHFFLHNHKSMGILLENTDLKIDEIVYDSTEFQFTGSEKYLRDLPFNTPDTIFSKDELRKFKKEAKLLNNNNQGDTACFYLKKSVTPDLSPGVTNRFD
jgi:hypothetical protein